MEAAFSFRPLVAHCVSAAPGSKGKNPSVWRSILVGNQPAPTERPLVVIRALHRALRQPDLLARDGFVWNEAEELAYAVEPGAPLVVRPEDVPRRMLRVGGVEHHVTGAGVLEPAAPRRQVHRA